MAMDLETLSEYTVHEAWLDLPERLPYARWEKLGAELGKIHRASQWWIGDWINYGEYTYGEKYAQAIDQLGLDYGTLANIAWVSNQVAPERRRPGLSWTHHREAASLDDEPRAMILQESEERGFTSRQTRDACKAYRARLRASHGVTEASDVEDGAVLEGSVVEVVTVEPRGFTAVVEAAQHVVLNARDDVQLVATVIVDKPLVVALEDALAALAAANGEEYDSPLEARPESDLF